MTIKQEQHTAVAIPPIVMPLMGLMFGLLVWVADAFVDVYVLGEEQDLVSNIMMPDEFTELWMRTLVVVVFLIMGFFSQRLLRKHVKLDRALRDYQKNLEEMVGKRTRELADKTRQLEILETTDSLTGLYNRRKFNSILEHEMNRFERYESPLCLLLVDIDRFKAINDAHGHDVGDQVIIQLANILKTGVRRSDCVSRWGGEEFLLMNIEISEQQACQVAEKLRIEIGQTDFETVGKLSVSIGVAQIKGKDSAESLLKRVDQALHSAKNNGRDRVASFTEVQ